MGEQAPKSEPEMPRELRRYWEARLVDAEVAVAYAKHMLGIEEIPIEDGQSNTV